MTRPLSNEQAERFPTADAMLNLWNREWSPRALKFATWALHRARRAGCDVLENPRVMESMTMATEDTCEVCHYVSGGNTCCP